MGFKMILTNFNGERLSMSAMALGFSECCYDEALAWARQRKTFGTALVDHQVIRHKLMDMRMRIESTRAWLDAVVARADSGDKAAKGAEWVAQVCLLKNHATQTMQFCADQAVQILGDVRHLGRQQREDRTDVTAELIGHHLEVTQRRGLKNEGIAQLVELACGFQRHDDQSVSNIIEPGSRGERRSSPHAPARGTPQTDALR